MSRFLLHKSIFFLILSLLFVWLTIGFWHDERLKHKDLLRHEGWVTDIDSFKVYHKYSTKPDFVLAISLNNKSAAFKALPRKRYGKFTFITSKVSLGDTVELFTKPRLWQVFGLGRKNQIVLLRKGDQEIIKFRKTKDGPVMLLFVGTFSLAFLIFSIWMIIKNVKALNSKPAP